MRKTVTPLLLLVLAACGSAATAPTATPTVSLATPFVTVTATLRPATATAEVASPTRIPPALTPIVLRSAVPAGTLTSGTTDATRPTPPIGTASGGSVFFSDPHGRFTFLRPSAWMSERQTNPDIVIQLDSDRPPGSFSVATETVASGVTLPQYVEAGVTQVRKGVAGYEPGPRGITSGGLSGEPASVVDYYTTAGGTRLYYVQIIVLREGTVYVLTFNTRPADQNAYLAQAQTIVDSWRFLPTG